ncbi:hypothetical protein BJF89_04270 [Corynebacterium sp. CNJ-954]|jgi:ABC-type nitrate/sulfonate/bicarbonate transport system substrate-binding protein|uniref:ABC transporter substrate-binding protein n=1 Tax=Corynebacterium sp. CNJ-954 TaxID=1904962 RepID=UPI000959C2A6|nr:ABC transporter substrate-binding protein [Corynebacterium sp. CNJ-954]OLT52696.1 hypothetical protein BJF89_04270 [Corynebacterium sp. CNJ-954]
MSTSLTRNWVFRLVVAIILLAAVVVAGRTYAAKSGTADENRVRIGWVSAATWVPWATLDEELDDGTNVELTPFKSSNDALTALANGSVDMAPVGYNNLASLLTSGNPRVSFVSGISSNGSVFLAREGSGIDSWDDLKGKRIGSVRGSTQYINLAAAMETRGMDIDRDTQYMNMQSFPDLNLALQRGDVDGIVTFPPLSGEAEEAGYGHIVPDIQDSLYDGSFSVASGILANDAFLENNRDEAVEVMRAFSKRLETLADDPETWEREYQDITGSSGTGISTALEKKYIVPILEMPEDEINGVPPVLTRLGIIDDDDNTALAEHLDYSILEDVTGRTATDLGKNGDNS